MSTTVAAELSRRERRRSTAAYAVLAVGVLGALGHLVLPSPGLRALVFAPAALVGILALVVGVTRLPPSHRRPWWLVLATALLFLGGAVGRQLPLPGPLRYLPDALSIVGYAAMCLALLSWLKLRGARHQRGALPDALLVAAGASLAAWALLLVPTLGTSVVSGGTRVLYVVYPVLDLVVLTLLLRLALLRSSRHVAFWLLVATVGLILLGDVLFALSLLGRGASMVAAESLYLVAYGVMGAAALHPSAERLTHPAAEPVTGWSRARLAGVAVALLTPSLLLVLSPATSAGDRLVRAALAAVCAGLVLHRAAGAINGYVESERAAHHRAAHDVLTGLPNRSHLEARLADELAEPHNGDTIVSVLFLDLDGFKLVNDSYGHAVGDELLVAAARRIQRTVRESDFVARLGGDEFVILCRHTDLASVDGLADRVLSSFGEPFVLSTGAIFVSPSIGIAHAAVCPGRTGDAGGLLREADAAMYKAKAAGRNRAATFDDSLREASRRRIEQETGLREALDDDSFEVHYQPVIRLGDGSLVGYEALLRWRHPTRGLLGPERFIAVAEDSWLIVPIGTLVLRRALAQLALWRRERPGLHVAVNVSARQVRDAAFPEVVAASLREADLPGSALCLELTEHALVEDTVHVAQTLAALRALGVTIAVDDFGTGYSALGYLKRLPVSIVKIDKSFVDGLPADPDDHALVRAIIAMAQALGLEVVAEGVETPAQETTLRALGCPVAQGWRYGPPLPADAVDAALAAGSSVVPLAAREATSVRRAREAAYGG